MVVFSDFIFVLVFYIPIVWIDLIILRSSEGVDGCQCVRLSQKQLNFETYMGYGYIMGTLLMVLS